MRRTRSLVLALPILLAACASAPEDGSAPPAAPETAESDPGSVATATYDARTLPATAAQGALALSDDIGVFVPAAGETAGIEVHRADGTFGHLQIAHDLDGTVHVVDAPNLPVEPQDLRSTALPACKDGAYALEGFHWASAYHYSFRASSTPSGYAAANVEAAINRASAHIARSHNDCGLADLVSAMQVYDGRTTRGTNVASTTTSVSCGNRDGHNVVAFGALPQNYLGVTCYWYGGDHVALEADMKINGRYHAWFTDRRVPTGCTTRFGLEATATHEFGHVFGLAHVTRAADAHLTMSPSMGPCTLGPATLGLGDIRGLRATY